jgi:hypothetical protein
MISILSFSVNLFAGDSVSIAVSCTVPSIPGLNAPLLEKTASRQSAAFYNDKQQTDKNMAAQQPVVETIEKEDQGKEMNSQGQDEIILVKTFYAR